MADKCKQICQPEHNIFHKADVSEKQVIDFVKDYYGFDVEYVNELHSFVDRNFHFKVKPGSRNNISPHGYVLKILNSHDSKFPEIIDGMNKLMKHINENVISTPELVQNINGDEMFLVRFPSVKDQMTLDQLNSDMTEDAFNVRVLTYVPGQMLSKIPFTRSFCYHSGQMTGKIAKSLQNFTHEGIMDRDFIWIVKNVPSLRNFIYAVDDKNRRSILAGLIDKFEASATKNLQYFTPGIIHGDLNELNILATKSGEKEDYKWCGVLDYGHVQYSYPLFDLTVLMAYMMADSKTSDPVHVGGHILAGYLQFKSIPQIEFNHILICIYGRICQSLVLGAYTHKQDPENNYILTSAANMWRLMDRLIDISEEEIVSSWIEIIQSYGNEHLPDYLQHK